MRRLLAGLSPLWQVQRRRRPAATAVVEDVALAARGRASLISEVRELRGRLRELERDHLLLAAHVATLTEQVGTPVRRGAEADAPARDRARLAAIAAYEERIGRLEDAVQRPRRARSALGAGTAGEPLVAAR